MRRTSMPPVLLPVLVLVLLGAPSVPALGAPVAAGEADVTPPSAHADRDHDGLSDDLERLLRGEPDRHRVDVLVTFDGPGDAASSQRAVGRFAVQREFEIIRGFSARMTAGQIRRLAVRPGVRRIEPDFAVSAVNDAANADFGTAAARPDFGVDGAGTEVCVVDTGVDVGHEQFDTKLNGAGKIPFYDAVNGRSQAYDDNGHGTHVAATAVGDGTGSANAAGYGGVAPGAALSAAKVLDANGSGTASQVVAGIEWCAKRAEADVVSLSLGTTGSSDGQDSISLAVNQAVDTYGKVAVVAAGNSGDAPYTVGSPGAAAKAITVAAAAEWSSGTGGGANGSRGIHLAPWSSRGPTADERVKPDITAPGVSITSAQHGTTAGYVTFSGTSMATPFTSGTVALMLDAGASAGNVKSMIASTAEDRGPAGQDSDWGFGLLDGYEAVAVAAGGSGQTVFPDHDFLSATVPDNGSWTHTFDVTDTSVPIAATVLVAGTFSCGAWWFGTCFIYEWDGPDLDVRLKDPSGSIIDESVCPLYCHSSSIGRQETIEVMPTTTGTYVLEVFPYSGDPNYGRGGAFTVDLSTDPAGASTEDPSNTAPVATTANASTAEDTPVAVTLEGSDAESCLSFGIVSGPSHGSVTAPSNVSCTSGTPNESSATVTYTPSADWSGTDSFTFRVTDAGGLTSDATVSIEVTPANDAPTASFTYACTNLACTFDATGSSDVDLDTLSYSWAFGDGGTATGSTPGHTYAAGGSYTVMLTVSDGASTDTSSQVVSVSEASAGITLSASGYKVKGLQKADLTWSGATSTNVDVYRDGVKIATTANDGAFTDHIDQRGKGSYTYEVCEAGTSTCSGTVTVAFS